MTDKKYYDENSDLMDDTTDKSAEAKYPGGAAAWSSFLQKNLYFPDQYKIVNADAAAVVVTFTIDENGEIKDAYISTPFYPAFDVIALKAVKHSPKWIPAFRNNRTVTESLRQVVLFNEVR